jgi:hypothetical protein
LTWIALVSDSYTEALEYSEQSLTVAATPFDRYIALNGKGCALLLLRQTEEGMKLLNEDRSRCIADGDLYNLAGSDPVIGVSNVLQGNIREGIRFLEGAILRREEEGYQLAAEWYGLLLCEVYLQIIGGSEKPPLMVLFRNLPVLLKVLATAPSRIGALTRRVLEDPRFCGAGYFVGRAQMTLGLLHKIKKRHDLALQHLTEARRVLAPFGQSPRLTRLEAALGELGR